MKAICVYCGSSEGRAPLYRQQARKLGETVARRGLDLVYGGSRHGLMGEVAEGALSMGGRVIGVLPGSLRDKEVAHPGLSALHITQGMHERKAKMADLSDAFVALPGGFGTLDEIMEMITWNQLKFQAKPIGFLDAGGYFEALFRFMEKASVEGFIQPDLVRALVREGDAESLVQALLNRPWPTLGPWPQGT
ncbi:MAG TPA: TIGR00730 family Rossman fold protein [bacterium]|nr:TIGR00730 family Rossman fold protein [bacterium]